MARVAIGNNVVDFPDSMSPDDLQTAVSSAAQQLGVSKPPTTMEKIGGAAKAGWDALNVPAEMSRKGWNATADLADNALGADAPTGNLPLDVLKGTPGVIARTFAKTAPGFIDRNAILMSGALAGAKALAPAIKGVGSAIANTAESASGLQYKTPGILTDAANDATLLFGKGKDAAGDLYGQTDHLVRPELSDLSDHQDFVDKSLELAKQNDLNPAEALEARKSLDQIKKSVTGSYYRKSREVLDTLAKQDYAPADTAYGQGVRSDALQQAFPVNKSGGTSIMKSVLGTVGGILPTVAMSPFMQGSVATALGLAARYGAPLGEGANAFRSGSAMAELADLIRQRSAESR